MPISGIGWARRERSATLRPAPLASSAMLSPRAGWRGTTMVNNDGNLARSPRCAPMTAARSAGMGGGGGQGGGVADDVFKPPQRGFIGWQRRNVEFEIAGRTDPRRAELGIAFGIGRRLRQAKIELVEQSRDHARDAPP